MLRRNLKRYKDENRGEKNGHRRNRAVNGSIGYVRTVSPFEKINKFLTGVLLILAVISSASYYFVSDSEADMNKLARNISELAAENIELQNKLDNLHSFNKVDDFIKNNLELNTPAAIIEIPAAPLVPEPAAEPAPDRFKWSLGY